jgi:2,5-dioxopentanoate dehydrogenase
MTMTILGKSLLAGATGDTNGNKFRAVNPATNETLEPDFYEATPAELNQAVEAAATAFADFRLRPPVLRAQLLETMAAEIEALGDGLLERCRVETGLPLARLQGERGRTCGQLRLFAQVVREGSWVDARIDTALPDRQPLPRPDLRRMLIAIGPVAVFGASNFPLAFSVAGGDTASALAAGCPVVVKAHPAHPGTSELIGQAITRAVAACGLPAGLFSLVHGGPSVGIALVQHPAITAVGFTGSHQAGRALFAAAAARSHPIPFFAEMSGVNPTFLLPKALQDRGADIAKGLLGSFTLGVGQFCTKPGLVFVISDPAGEQFLQHIVKAVETSTGATMLTPGIHQAFEKNRDKQLGINEVTLLAAAKPSAEQNSNAAGASVGVTSAENFIGHPELGTETFGPFALIVKCRNGAEMLSCASALDGQLTATLHGTAADLDQAKALIELLGQKAGRLLVNGFPTGVEVSPAMNHGGPSPATSDVRFTSVGTAALLRFARPLCYQNFPAEHLPAALQDANPLGIMRQVNSTLTRDPLT